MSQTRQLHFDYLRAIMMFLGVLVHASHSDAGSGYFSLIRNVSGSFRMECFFLISGYFSWMLILKRGSLLFVKRRMIQLVIPALVCIILLVPIANYLMRSYYEIEGAGVEFLTAWMGHSWFLLSLIIYTLFLWLFLPLLNIIIFKFGGLSQTMFLILAVFVLSIFGQSLISKISVFLPYTDIWSWLVSTTIHHFPFFLLGIFMYSRQEIYDKFHQNSLVWFFSCLFFIALNMYFAQFEIISFGSYVVSTALDYMLALSLSGFLLSTMKRFFSGNIPFLGILADSCYTVYIVHYIIIAVILLTFQSVGINLELRLLVGFFGASFIGVLFHWHVVKKSSFFGYMFNGQSFVK